MTIHLNKAKSKRSIDPELVSEENQIEAKRRFRTCFGTGYYDYGFRQLDPQLGRWHVADAMAESYLSTSPYAYVANNPISFKDFMGLKIERPLEEDNFWNEYMGFNNALGHSGGGGYNSNLGRSRRYAQGTLYDTQLWTNSQTDQSYGDWYNELELGATKSGYNSVQEALDAGAVTKKRGHWEWKGIGYIKLNAEIENDITKDQTNLLAYEIVWGNVWVNEEEKMDVLDFTGALLTTEDVYNAYLHDHKNYKTNDNKIKRIKKSNGEYRSLNAARAARISITVKAFGEASNVLMVTNAAMNISNGSKDPWDYADATVGLAGTVGFALELGGYSVPVVGEFVAFYSWYRMWYQIGAYYGPIHLICK